MRKYAIVLMILSIAYGSLIGRPIKVGLSANNKVVVDPANLNSHATNIKNQQSQNPSDDAAKITNVNFIKKMLAQKYNELYSSQVQSQQNINQKVTQKEPSGKAIKETMKDYQKKLMQLYNKRQAERSANSGQNIDKGQNNQINGEKNIIHQGQGNNIDGEGNHISGSNNVIDSSKNLVFGSGNKILPLPDSLRQDFKFDFGFDQKENKDCPDNATEQNINQTSSEINQTVANCSQMELNETQQTEKQECPVEITPSLSTQAQTLSGPTAPNAAKKPIANQAQANSVVSNNWEKHTLCTMLLFALILVLIL